jgi:hypothetical protein
VMNGLRGGRYIFSGSAPVCPDCIARFAAGVVSEAYIQRWPAPRHIGCGHEYQLLRPKRLSCDRLCVG